MFHFKLERLGNAKGTLGERLGNAKQNALRTRSAQRSLLGFFCPVLYFLKHIEPKQDSSCCSQLHMDVRLHLPNKILVFSSFSSLEEI